jgi:hypothetical protein
VRFTISSFFCSNAIRVATIGALAASCSTKFTNVDPDPDAATVDSGTETRRDSSSDSGLDAQATNERIVFATNELLSVPTFGISTGEVGAVAANLYCTRAAALAKLPGTYRALLGKYNDPLAPNLFSRFQGKLGIEWKLPSGEVVANKPSQFDNGLLHAIDADEYGVKLPVASVYAFSGAQLGAFTPSVAANCDNWTDVAGGFFAGNFTSTSSEWYFYDSSPRCNTRARLYCVQD